MVGPSSNCVNYDTTSLLTNKDVLDIVNKINERRHFVAMGMLNRFPQAANMKKMRWSEKLASFAQRWADQCDPSVKPDREDQCRDLANMKVGQNIATVIGPSPGLSVKSFVDIWFMLNLQFLGSVTYYNQSKDSKTNYFTQLIWADTAFVGCGRTKFFVYKLNTVMERLVCNFAPKGNFHGKPIYTIGYPGTQCSMQMIPDIMFPGLCLQTSSQGTFIDKVSTASSLLRILNLSNNSLKQELDPNNLKQIYLNNSETSDKRNQKTRHVYSNNSYGAMKRDSLHFQNPIPNLENFNDPHSHTQRQYTQERGHSRMYHGYQSSKEPVYNMDLAHVHTETDFRRTYATTPTPFYTNSIQDARKHYVDSGCTRKMIPSEHNCFSPPEPPCKKTNECGRLQSHNCPQPNPCQHTALPRLDQLCPCNSPPPVPCDCNRNCQSTTSCPPFPTTYCPYRKAGGDEPNKSNKFENYDLFHNLEVKSGEEGSAQKQPWHFENLNPIKLDKSEYIGRESDTHRQVKAIVDVSKAQTLQDSYHSFGYSERKKRDLEDPTFKPFWQMDEYNQKKPYDLKSIKYTTFANKRNRKTRKTATITKSPTSTETITIKLKDKSTIHYSPRGRVTEKYLSFDELMHLRKLSTAEAIDGDGRRNAQQEEENLALRSGTTPKTTTTMTANTPFVRQKHCTRKLTCTWTGPMQGGGGSNNDINGGGGKGSAYDVGSRTPPGYVEGCTRTSTCTRIYMDRNKMATPSENPNSAGSGDGSGDGDGYGDDDGDSSGDGIIREDEDYCERRSLNIRRRNSNEKGVTAFYVGSQDTYTELPLLAVKTDEIIRVQNVDPNTDSQTDNFHCICYEDATRVKRGEIDQSLYKDCNGKKVNEKFKGLPLIHDCLKRMNLKSKNSKTLYQCPCNGINSLKNALYKNIKLIYCFMWVFYYMHIVFY